MLVDFHMHSTYSDGRMKALDLAKSYHDKGINVIAITDHDEIGAYKELGSHPFNDFTIVPGIEVSSTYKEKDVHILGYQYDSENKELNEYVVFYKNNRADRIFKMIENAQKEGYKVTREDLIERFGVNKSYGRPHLAQILIAKGYVSSIDEAFTTLLSHSSPIYVPKFKIEPLDVIKMISQAGGISILAHPILIRNDDYVRTLLQMGLNGVEVYHSKQKKEDENRYLAMAKEYNLLVSGGSDYHALPGRFPENIGDYLVQSENISAFMKQLGLK